MNHPLSVRFAQTVAVGETGVESVDRLLKPFSMAERTLFGVMSGGIIHTTKFLKLLCMSWSMEA